ncbi:hypothetical protein [Photobacterium phosphoreum]|uniref:hypothetical protein n=1 Tax=Photobacterium phosphoreum TaxID=659 RepID=UPI001E3CE470|nr:hypothetical protein [Photobacterium phosphoreum]MCD9480488.1 hypothetical protein [Photobacterium phosphoreum]
MSILEKKDKLLVQDETSTVAELLEHTPKDIAGSVQAASIVILPSHGSGDAFYIGTLDTLDYLNENDLPSEVFATDDEYKELGLHGAEFWIGTFIIKNFAIPIFCSLIAAYVYDKLKAKDDDKISLKFIVENKTGKTTSVSFDGKAEKLSKVLDEVKKFSDED